MISTKAIANVCLFVGFGNEQVSEYYVRPKKGCDFTINPLPLLTAEGNGRGTNMDMIGIWSRNLIEYATELPNGLDYKKIYPKFVES